MYIGNNEEQIVGGMWNETRKASKMKMLRWRRTFG